jgi:hypothetical protein
MNAVRVKARLEELTAVAKQTEINLHALGGAIQDCNYWLKLLEDEDALNQIPNSEGTQSQHQEGN